MYISMKDILGHAHRHNYAVMAMNSINMEMARAAINAAEEECSAIIINIGPGQMAKHAHASEMVPMIINMAKRATVPISLNLDHGQDFKVICDCINNGFSGIMIDASIFAFEENVRRTQIICDLAHPLGICVEGELGHVGQANIGDEKDIDLYTNPDQAKKFIEMTGVDALAVAIGTAHGMYPECKLPKLDFVRLALLKDRLDMPLVLHGGSGAGEENLRKAVDCGINKINVCTDAFQVAKNAVLAKVKEAPETDYMNLCMAAEAAVKQFVKEYMHIIGSNNRYVFGKAKIETNE
jgi:fructose-bisphosphate aldolase, class II